MAPIIREYSFDSFEDTIAFISRVSKIFSRENHHPKIINFYNTVAFHYFTTDANNEVTYLDRKIADEVESVYKSFCPKS
ncbi:MAG: 4a-hydroxytetrahydrobiopterin dehydratase [Flavobacteriales bacterium]|nr:4a-hydroxytetrahydrobiopterin dehydratase [Flavobacteriales bacterium]